MRTAAVAVPTTASARRTATRGFMRSVLLARDAVLIAVKSAVVVHRGEVERRAAPEVRDRIAALRHVVRSNLPDAVRIARVHCFAALPARRNCARCRRRRL